MALSRDARKDAMRSVAAMGEVASRLGKGFRWRKLSSEEIRVRGVLLRVEATGDRARDVLDMMEDNDGT